VAEGVAEIDTNATGTVAGTVVATLRPGLVTGEVVTEGEGMAGAEEDTGAVMEVVGMVVAEGMVVAVGMVVAGTGAVMTAVADTIGAGVAMVAGLRWTGVMVHLWEDAREIGLVRSESICCQCLYVCRG
jgi:hypothetical protein